MKFEIFVLSLLLNFLHNISANYDTVVFSQANSYTFSAALSNDIEFIGTRDRICPQYSFLFKNNGSTFTQLGGRNDNCALNTGLSRHQKFSSDNTRYVMFGVTNSSSQAYVINPTAGSDPLNNPFQLIPNTYYGSISNDGFYMVFCDYTGGNCYLYTWDSSTSRYIQASAIPQLTAVIWMRMSPNGNYMAIIKAVNITNKAFIYQRNNNSFVDLGISDQGISFISCDMSNTIAAFVGGTTLSIFELQSNGSFSLFQTITRASNLNIVRVSYDNWRIFVGDNSNNLFIYAKTTNYQIETTMPFTNLVNDIDVSLDSITIMLSILNTKWELITNPCPLLTFCGNCSSNLNCNICQSGYGKYPIGSIGCCVVGETWSINNGTGCVSCPSTLNCDRCDISNQCTICNTNYTLFPSSADGCCLFGYTWSINNGTGCVSCPSTLNCDRCDISNQCTICLAGYTLSVNNGTGCVSCPSTLNCNRCDISNQCTICLAGYTLSVNNGTGCVSCPSTLNCNRCDISNQCTICLAGYTLSVNNGTGCVSCPSTLNCNRCDISNQCTICLAGYTLSVNNGTGCVSCPSTLNCNRCDISNQCMICLAGYTLSVNNGTGCVSCPSTLNCNRCDIPNQCTICNTNYSLLLSSSIGCCLKGYTFNNLTHECIICPLSLNCLQCNSPNKCQLCNSNFYLFSNLSDGCCPIGSKWSHNIDIGCLPNQQQKLKLSSIISLSICAIAFCIFFLICYRLRCKLPHRRVIPYQQITQNKQIKQTMIFFKQEIKHPVQCLQNLQ